MQHQSDILNGMMIIHLQVTLGLDIQIKPAVNAEQRQHMIEKGYAGVDIVSATANRHEK